MNSHHHRSTGPHRVITENGGLAEAVVKMRHNHHGTALMVCVGPYGTAQADDFPPGGSAPNSPPGESGAGPAASSSGMRVQRFPDFSDFQTPKAGKGQIIATQARYIIIPTENGNITRQTRCYQ